ncbi:carbonic anhydrase [Actinoplanes sp. RD1]|uniref:carbonic anhydrase n=1 Tax=Actinoplanes sp. RD1 TaxID=3064538 RepID=UPI002741AF32|nr:carbonic anhydrase [Actinoplanes sp. RD1]
MARTVLSRRALLATGGAALVTTALPAVAANAATPQAAAAATTPGAALELLLAGNRRVVAGKPTHPNHSAAQRRKVATAQHPFAITLGCADSRVSPEVLFDRGVGDIFDNRVAGNIVDDLLLGSVEFAVAEFATPLIMVLGHERCGAIKATLGVVRDGGTPPGHIGAIVHALRPVVEPLAGGSGDVVEQAVQDNVRTQAAALINRSELIRERVAAGALRVVGARYDLDTGRVTIVK